MTTYTNMFVHLIMAVEGRRSFIGPFWSKVLYAYIKGIIRNKGQYVMAINGMRDHIHILIEIRSWCSIADLVREVKKSTNRFINRRKFTKDRFNWQVGYGAFTCSRKDIHVVMEFIGEQSFYHERKTFKDEFLELLKQHDIPYTEKYLFDFIDSE